MHANLWTERASEVVFSAQTFRKIPSKFMFPSAGPRTWTPALFIDCLLSIYTTSASGIQGGNNKRERLDSDYQVPKEHPV